MKVVIPDDYQHVVQNLRCFSHLKDFEVEVYHDAQHSIETLVQRFASADALVLTRERTVVGEALLARLPRLKLISQTGKASAHLDVDACTRHGVAIAEGTGSPVAPAELTWALIMAAMRNLVPAVNAMRQGRWQVNIGDCLAGKTLGIWGFGKIGRRLARYAQAFDMKVLIWGSEGSRQAAADQGLAVASSKAQFFADSDMLSLHLRLTQDTRALVQYEDLIRMKPEALFVNTSRSELVADGALEQALLYGRPGRAALDVYEQEPVIDPGYWALKMDNVLCSPHLGYVESAGYELYFDTAFRNVIEFFAGRPANILNPKACSR
ncbi:D-2-hydroxyacid dehydrogenase family protein [Marinobacterium rhizophilum]|uniref:D-2-hydroxyacid dehydrogenase family protein n=1 Tax=Marinobacterium rhizophilum TaxID=420402 RepID=UPI0003656330|nr:D-2-hydroxyacid dehydrogenase family protein [Marinobacterium rhizophilum]